MNLTVVHTSDWIMTDPVCDADIRLGPAKQQDSEEPDPSDRSSLGLR